MIHPTAVISSNAKIDNDVKIGPFSVVGDNVTICKGSKLHSHVCIMGNTKIGESNIFYPFCSIGHAPQDKKYKGEKSELIIGDGNIFREHVTVNPGTESGGMITKIENNCLIMVGAHIAHDCHIRSNVILVNNVTLAGHVNIFENAIIGGLSGIHQFVNIGKYAMIGGMSGVESNIIPYGLYTGIRSELRGLNLVGLKRKGLSKENINQMNSIIKEIFNEKNSIEANINNLSNKDKNITEISEIINFINLNFKRGIARLKND
tara:strand:- start:588 stop:1373 length:786 start_codon:yes stop_codon:yes gene_type:complete